MLKNFRVYAVTWNVCGKQPTEDMKSLLGLPKNVSKENTLPELFSIHLQEVNSQPQNMLLDMIFDDPWTQAFTSLLKGYNYIRLKVERLQGILLILFLKRSLLTSISGIESSLTRSGLGGMWGNKGAVSVRFNINGCCLCFVNSHLAAHLEENEKRINDYGTIIDGQKFDHPQTNLIITHDYVFWAGDLNFRLKDISPEEVNSSVAKNILEDLIENDQLKEAMQSGQAFSEFQEPNPTFPPTYKFLIGTDDYDLNRVPSWTDRVMYRCTPNAYDGITLAANQIDYKSHPSYKLSDHKPVSSSFEIKVFNRVSENPVQFYSIDNWWMNTDNTVLYKVLESFKPTSYDWVGLYKANFTCVTEQLCYVWASNKPVTETESTARSPDSPNAASSIIKKLPPVYRVIITDQSVILPGTYCLAYISSKQWNVLGVSDHFEVKPHH